MGDSLTVGGYVLAKGAAISPDVPVALVALLGAELADLGALEALVLAIVPLADVLADLDLGPAVSDEMARRGLLAVGFPGELRGGDAEIEELKGALGTLTGGDIAGEMIVG